MEPTPPPPERAYFDAFDRFLQAYITLLNAAKLPHPAGSLADLLVGGLLAKVLRLADALLALARGGQARESGPTIRALLTTYVNLRFLATHEQPDEAAAAYVMHSERTLAELRKHVVREDRAGEGFPAMTPEQWAASSASFEEQRERIRREQIRGMAKIRPVDRKGRPQEPLDWSWTGMTDKELFDHVGEADGYRFYAFHSNEVHANVSGVGDVFTELSAGGVDFIDYEDTMVGGSLTLGAKYVVLAMTVFDEYHHLGQDTAIDEISKEFLAAVVRHREEWHKRHDDPVTPARTDQ